MNLDSSCGIPAGLLRLLKFSEEDATHPTSWNLQKSRDGSFSLKFWTRGVAPISRAKKGADSDNRTRKRDGTKRPRAEKPVTVEKPCSLDSSKLSPKILELPKSSGKKRKSKPPSRVKRNRRRWSAWKLQQQLARENLQLHYKLQRQKENSTSSSSSDTESSPEPSGSGPDLLEQTEVLENVGSPDIAEPKGVFKESAVPVEESTSTLEVKPDTPEGSVVDYSDTDLDSNADCETSASTTKPIHIPHKCVNCGVSEGTLRSCSACKAVKYCSVECQKDNWCEHKLTCAELKRFLQ